MLRGVMTFSEAAERWGLNPSTLRKAVMEGRFRPNECSKSGKVHLVTIEGMERLYGKRGGMNMEKYYESVKYLKDNWDNMTIEEKIDYIIDDVIKANIELVVRLAFDQYIEGMHNGYCAFNMKTLELEGIGLGQNESLRDESQYIWIYKIHQNFLANENLEINGGWLDDKEFEQWEKVREEVGYLEWLESNVPGGYQERMYEILLYSADDDINWDDIESQIEEKLSQA